MATFFPTLRGVSRSIHRQQPSIHQVARRWASQDSQGSTSKSSEVPLVHPPISIATSSPSRTASEKAQGKKKVKDQEKEKDDGSRNDGKRQEVEQVVGEAEQGSTSRRRKDANSKDRELATSAIPPQADQGQNEANSPIKSSASDSQEKGGLDPLPSSPEGETPQGNPETSIQASQPEGTSGNQDPSPFSPSTSQLMSLTVAPFSSDPNENDPTHASSLPLPPAYHPPRLMQKHPFNTYGFVRRLEKNNFPRNQAREVMQATRQTLMREETRARALGVPKEELDNEAYLFSAALGELRTEVEVKARNDAITLRSMQSQLGREVEGVERRISESMRNLHNDIQLDFNTRKEEFSTDQKGLEMKIVELNNKFTILIGELKTDVEAKKWIQTRQAIAMIAIITVIVVAYTALYPYEPPPKPAKDREHDLPSAESLGVRRVPDDQLEGTVAPWLGGKRVGEDEDQQ